MFCIGCLFKVIKQYKNIQFNDKIWLTQTIIYLEIRINIWLESFLLQMIATLDEYFVNLSESDFNSEINY